jgi:trimeric autotransporter adhesin
MAALTNTDPNITYKDLLQLGSGTGTGLTGSLQTVRDGLGNACPLQLSTGTANFTTGGLTYNGQPIAIQGAFGTVGAFQTLAPFSTNGTFSTAGTFATAGNFATAGAFPMTLTVTASTSVILPITGTLATLMGVETLTNKTLTTPKIATILTNSGANTVTLPITTDTLVGKATTDTLTNKTLTSPIISTISNTGTLTLPTSTDTLIGRATTDTLTNKTLTNPTVTTGSFTSPTLVTPALGTPASGVLTNCTGLPEAGIVGTAWTATSATVTGFSATTQVLMRYKIVGKICHVILQIVGTSNTTGFTVTNLPVTSVNDSLIRYYAGGLAVNSGGLNSLTASLAANSTTLILYLGAGNNTAASWTASGDKEAYISFFYETT